MRGENFRQVDLNIVGSSTFGRYPKISIEKTYNMFESDNWLVPYAGYQIAIPNLGKEGRGDFVSIKLNRIVAVFDENVFLINIFFDQNIHRTFDTTVINIGTLQTSTGIVYITENNKPQITISDGVNIYFYDPSLTPSFQVATQDGSTPINFTPGYIDFHDTYILCAASNDNTYSPQANNTWRLGVIDANTGKLIFPDDSAHVGLLQTKPDNVQAVIRFPSAGNMILVMGQTVTEPWYNVGYQLFPYQRSSGFSMDYGCLNPATIAKTDELVVWLAQNEKSGPIIMYSTGGRPEKVTTDGIDYLFAQLSDPSDSQAFLYRQDGHIFYHINFYTDNFSLFVDFLPNGEKKIYHASDENLNYFIARSVVFFNNQYYFISKNNGNLYSFDTAFTTYNGAEIPRFRACANIRDKTQGYFVANDVGFTIEQGETPFQMQNAIIGLRPILWETQNNNLIISQDGNNLIFQQEEIETQVVYTTPRVDLSISIDGGESFSSDFPYNLNPLGQRRNRLMWWQLGLANDMVCLFKFWGMGRFIATNGVMNIRT